MPRCFYLQVAHAQLKTISGSITDENGKAVPHTNIEAKGAKTVQTNDNGGFSISVPESVFFLTITNTAFQDTSVDITGKATINITLLHKVIH